MCEHGQHGMLSARPHSGRVKQLGVWGRYEPHGGSLGLLDAWKLHVQHLKRETSFAYIEEKNISRGLKLIDKLRFPRRKTTYYGTTRYYNRVPDFHVIDIFGDMTFGTGFSLII